MRKTFIGFALTTSLIALVALGQTPSPTETPMPTPQLVSTSTPTPTPTVSPSDAGTVSVPSFSTASPSPTAPISVRSAALVEGDLGWSERGAPKFTIEQAVLTALRQNPDVLRALEEIKRTKGVIIEISAAALPHVGPSSDWEWMDPNLR